MLSERLVLQVTLTVAALVPVSAGLAGIVGGPGIFGPHGGSVVIDSHFRYLSGLLLAIGLAFWSFVPRIRVATAEVRLLTVMVFIGGLGRLISLMLHGAPSAGMMFGLGMELIVTPALCLWQARVAKAPSD